MAHDEMNTSCYCNDYDHRVTMPTRDAKLDNTSQPNMGYHRREKTD